MHMAVEYRGCQSVDVYRRRSSKEPHFTIEGACIEDLDPAKVRDYLEGCDWTDRGSRGWIHPHVRCDEFLKERANDSGQGVETVAQHAGQG